MSNSIWELILTFGCGIVVAALAFLWARRSLTANDDIILTREDSKFKSKNTKQTLKIKTAKKETTTTKQKSSPKAKTNPTANSANVGVVKNQTTIKEVTESITASVVERIRSDSTAEWTKVKKPSKKPKKESKLEVDNSSVDDVKVAVKEIPVKETVIPMVVVDKETAPKRKETNQVKVEPVKELPVEVNGKSAESAKSTKSKKFVTEQNGVVHQEIKAKAASNEVKPKVVPDEREELKEKINQLTTDLEKLKANQREEGKSNNQTSKEAELLKQKLKNSQANEEKLIEDLKKKGQAVTDLKNQFLIIQSELTKNIVSSQSVNREKLSLENRLRSLEDQNMIMDEKCQHFEKIKIEHGTFANNLRATEEELKNVKHEYTDILKNREKEFSNQINILQSEKQRLQDQLVRVQTDLIENNNKMQSFQQELLTAKNAHADQLTENLRLQKLYADQKQSSLLIRQQELTDFDNKTKQLEEQVASLTKQINDINAININLSGQKNDLQLQIDELHKSKLVVDNSEANDLKEKIVSVNQEIVDLKKRLLASETETKEYISLCEKQTIQSKELTTERDNLIALVDQYKTGLESTELILSKLQTSVNEEESKWRESLMKSETEAEKSKKELEIVFNDLIRIRNSRAGKNELNFAYHCVDKSLSSLIDEMEARMIHFEKCFDTVVQERDNALAQMSSQINGVSDKHENGNVNFDEQLLQDKTAELDKLNADLQNQIDLNKTLENQCNKYRSLIDIGKDALNEEQAHVRELQEKLNSLQSSCINVEIPLNSNSF